MPIYMDRHYIEGLTEEMVAQAHEEDLKIQGKYGVNIITYWYDEKRMTNFCLIDAPDMESIRTVHNEAHGSIPHEIIEVDPIIVQSFLGRMKDPEPEPETKKVNIDNAFRAIMFTDLKDSTLMTSTYGDEKGLHLLHVHNSITRNALRKWNGREIKHTGDGIMASFKNVSDSVQCAIDIQSEFDKYNKSNPNEQLFLRIGINAGEPIEEHGDLFGTVVQLAARLCAFADPGDIVVSGIIEQECLKEQVKMVDMGQITPKGFTKEVSIFRVEY